MNDFRDTALKVIDAVISNPDNTAGTFYSEKKVKFFSNEVINYSPYIPLNNQKLICITTATCGKDSKQLTKSKDREVYITEDPTVGTVELEAIRIDDLYIESSDEPYTDLKVLRDYALAMSRCNFSVSETSESRYLSSDIYTNNLLILIFINHIYDRLPAVAGMKGVIKLYNSTIYNQPNTGADGD